MVFLDVLFFDQSKYIDIVIEALNVRHLAIYFMLLIQNNEIIGFGKAGYITQHAQWIFSSVPHFMAPLEIN